jgi:tripartite-type tricarboxylate transporter receptor subunit TctC
MSKKLIFNLLAVLSAFIITPTSAQVSTYPNKPIALLVPYAPGGSTDITARLIAEHLSKRLGQQVVVENRAGAGGNIGANVVAQSAPDGYTLLMAPSSLVANISLYKSLPYDLRKDLEPISRIAMIPNVLVIGADSKINTFAEFIAAAKVTKPPLNYGSAGSGSSQHLAGALFANTIKIEMGHIPYKGGAPALVDLMGGRLDAVFAPLVEVLPFIQGKKLKALAVTTPTRSFALPDVPTVAETFPGFDITLWNSIMTRNGTPPEIIAKLNQAIQYVLAQPEVLKTLRSQGSNPSGNTIDDFKKLIAQEVPKWAEIIKLSGAETQ